MIDLHCPTCAGLISFVYLREMPSQVSTWCVTCNGTVPDGGATLEDILVVADAGCDCPLCTGMADEDYDNDFYESLPPTELVSEPPEMFKRFEFRRPAKRRDVMRRNLRRFKRRFPKE
jgi:hypothetical protein